MPDFLELESGTGYLLLESGDGLLLEFQTPPVVPPSSWEWKLEEWAIAQCNAAASLPDTLQLRHHDDADQAATERIFFKATTGEQNPPGLEIYNTALLVEFRSTNRNSAQTDAIFAEMFAIFTRPIGNIPENSYFTAGLWFDQEESTNARNDGDNTRDRSRTFAFQVGQIG